MSRHFVRSLAFCSALLATGATIAAPSQNAAAADCVNRANIQYSVDTAQCGMYPTYAPIYGECISGAARSYANALAACAPDTSSSSALGLRNVRPGKPGGVMTLKQGG